MEGYVERLFVDYTGVEVKAGDHLVEIYSPDLLVAQQELLTALEGQRSATLVESAKRKQPFFASAAEALAARRLVRPLATQGHISNLAPEVMTFEAGSASGSSGSPIVNRAGRVIAVNRGSLRKTGGLNVGIPIQFARELLNAVKVEPALHGAGRTP